MNISRLNLPANLLTQYKEPLQGEAGEVFKDKQKKRVLKIKRFIIKCTCSSFDGLDNKQNLYLSVVKPGLFHKHWKRKVNPS